MNDLPSYIATNIEELFLNSPDEIKAIIKAGEPDQATIRLSSNYNIPVSDQTALSNVITFVLIGAIEPDDVLTALQELVNVDEATATKIAMDLEHSIFEKARITLLKKSGDGVKTLEFQGQKSKEELRKEIMDTTKRTSGLQVPQSGPAKKPSVIAPGSRSQLMEQLQILGTIPNDEEIEERLKHIQEQINAIKKQEEDNTLDSNIALKSFMFGEKGKEVATPTLRPATYSAAPTKYNVDPYREVVEE